MKEVEPNSAPYPANSLAADSPVPSYSANSLTEGPANSATCISDSSVSSLSKGALVLTHGLPGSGKSSLARRLMALYPQKTVLAERDELRNQLLPPGYFARGFDLASEDRISLAQEEILREGLAAGKVVIASDTNLAQQRIRPLVTIARSFHAQILHFHFDLSQEECHRRNKARAAAGGRLVPEDVIEDMAEYGYSENGRIKSFSIREVGSEPYSFAVMAEDRSESSPSMAQELGYIQEVIEELLRQEQAHASLSATL